MQLHIRLQNDDGELPVSMNPGDGDPFAIIDFGGADLNLESDEEADRIIRAAQQAKLMRSRIGTAHMYMPGAGPHSVHCTYCGLLRHSHDEAAS